jgi:hypothetical protein
MVVASMNGMGDGRSSQGEITRENGKYWVLVDGSPVGPSVGSLRAAAERLAHGIGEHLPKNASTWRVSAMCTENGLSITVGNVGGGGGGGGGQLHPCARRVLGERRIESIEAALEAFAQVIGRCCG